MNPQMSPWAVRIQEAVDVMTLSNEYDSTVSNERVADTLPHFAMCRAKFLWSSDQEKSNSNPWIASLLAYVSAGDRGAIQDLPAAQHHVNVAVQAGWTMQDVLQVVEWNKGSMPIYPALAQWAQLFGTSQAQVLQAQHRLAPTMIELLEPREQHAWALTQALGLSFQDWTAQLKANPLQPTLKLPELGI